MPKDREKRINYVCDSCGLEIYETWRDINGGAWYRAQHTPEDCCKELHRRIKELELCVRNLNERTKS